MSMSSALLCGTSASAITAGLGGGSATPGAILTSYFRLYGVTAAWYQDNTVMASGANFNAVWGHHDENLVRVSNARVYAVWAP